jgi:hypothetical protein
MWCVRGSLICVLLFFDLLLLTLSLHSDGVGSGHVSRSALCALTSQFEGRSKCFLKYFTFLVNLTNRCRAAAEP